MGWSKDGAAMLGSSCVMSSRGGRRIEDLYYLCSYGYAPSDEAHLPATDDGSTKHSSQVSSVRMEW